MGSRKKSANDNAPKESKPLVRISKELRDNPVHYAGVDGSFGLGGEIVRSPRQMRNGMPPVKRPNIPEATEEQYIQLIKKGLSQNVAKYIHIDKVAGDTTEDA